MFWKIRAYIQDSLKEFKRVNWPTKERAVHLTLIVIAISAFGAVFLGSLDMIFTLLLRRFFL